MLENEIDEAEKMWAEKTWADILDIPCKRDDETDDEFRKRVIEEIQKKDI